jgi:gliding motility-associated-like protein
MAKKFFLLFFISTMFISKDFASHIVGGEIYYDCLGGNVYKITLKVYRNCYDGQSELDNPAYVFIFDAGGNFIDSLAMPLPGATVLPSVINNPCYTPPDNICVQEGIYQRNVYLPPIPGGYNISYQTCCRSNSIINMVDPGFVGSTYTTHIPDVTFAACNSSPHFDNFPPIFLCSGIPVSFDNSATDPDGDSLHYEFCDPFDGASPFCPSLGPQGVLSPCPEIGTPPPYSPAPWTAAYNSAYPMSSLPIMSIDPASGLLTGTPNSLGQWVIAVCVSEYRNGILLCTNKRDFLFNVINCQGLPVASFPPQTNFCNGFQTYFTQNSLNASTIYWDFGDPTTTSDYSYASAPAWTYPDPGTYTVSLIINKGTPCADTSNLTFNIQPLLQPAFAEAGECFFNNSFDFNAAGAYEGSGTFEWDFGSHASPQTANAQNVNNVVFDTVGTFPVTLTITENGCSEEYTSDVYVYEKPVANYGLASPVACVMQYVHFIDSSKKDSPLSYQWDFGDGSTSGEPNPYHIYETLGSYLTSVIITTAHGCSDTFDLQDTIIVLPAPTAGFTVTPTDTSVFYADITMTDQSSGTSACAVYWGDGTVYNDCDSVHRYLKHGGYTIMQVVVNTSGCYDTAYSEVIIRPEFMCWIPNAFTPGKDDGMNDIFKPKLIGVREYSFMIFNRWGEKMFETQDPADGWNGHFKGTLAKSDVYIYKISFRDDVRNDPHEYIGNVSLIR